MPANVKTSVEAESRNRARQTTQQTAPQQQVASVDVSPRHSANEIEVAPRQQATVAKPQIGSVASAAVRELGMDPSPVRTAGQQVPASRQASDAIASAAPAAPSRQMPAIASPAWSSQDGTAVPGRFAQTAGLAQPAQQERQPQGVPVLDMPAPGSMGAMSSRTPRFDMETRLGIHDALADQEAARIVSRGAASAPVVGRIAQQASEERARQASVARPAARRIGEEPVSMVESTGRALSELNKPVMFSEKDRSPRLKQPSNKRPRSVIDAVKKKFADSFRRSGVGYRVWGKVNGLPSLDLREVGIGIQEIVAAVEQDPSMIDRLIAQYTDIAESVASWSANEIAEFINSHDIYVGTFKPPNNARTDIQRRKLHVLTSQRRGIYMHPIMAAMYNADFDGDDVEVSFDPDVAKLMSDPMENMVGIDGKMMLNTDFLPVAKIVGGYSEGKTARDYVREVMLSAFSQIDGRTISPFIDAVIDLGDTAQSDGDAQAAAWSRVFMEARRVADSTRGGRTGSNDMMSRLCKAVFSGMQGIKVSNALRTIDADIVGMADLPSPRTYDDTAIYAIMRDMVVGEVPNNFQDLKVMLTGFIGNVHGKNAPFRFTADVGKMMKMDSRLQIGDGSFVVDPEDSEQMKLFFESTVKYAESQRMAVEVKKAGRSQYYSDLMRFRVINEAGFPEMHASFSEFLDSFVESYNRNSSMINEANLVYLSNMGIASDSNRGLVSPLNPSPGGVTFGDIAEPFMSIYGSYSVGRMFKGLSAAMHNGNDTLWSGNPSRPRTSANRPIKREYDYRGEARFWITGKYIDYNLRQFSSENRLIRGETGMEDERDGNGNVVKVGIRNTKLSSARSMSEVDIQFDMLLAIADKRTGTASTFNKSVYGPGQDTTVSMMSKLLTELDRLDTDGTVSGRRDQQLWIDDVASALIESGPDMFMHFGMDSPAGFLQSELARKMVEHRGDVEVLGGIRTAMVFDYRMERVNALMAEIPDANDDVDRYMDAYTNFELAFDELSASSEVWRGILKELRAESTPWQKSVFQMMRDGALMQTSASGRDYVWYSPKDLKTSVTLDAMQFWKDPGDHTTLLSIIEDLDMPRQMKWNIITDVVRYWEQDAYLKSYEVGYQLEVGSDASYSLGSSNSQGALTVHRDFQEAFNRWSKTSQENLQENIDRAAAKWRSRPGSLMRTLERLAKSPWELIAVDDLMYADSLASVLDKAYAQTEKAKQHPWTNLIYSALSFQRNGGFMNDVTRTDDRLIGLQDASSIGPMEIIRILADPDVSITAYNEDGGYAVLNREILLKNALGHELSPDIENDIWEFLVREPRVAAAIRQHRACAVSDTDGSGYIGALLSTDETIRMCSGMSDPVDHVKYLMRDHPVYAGIVSMANRAYGSVARNARQRIAATEAYLSSLIYTYASSSAASSAAAYAILVDIGITPDTVTEALRSDYDRFCELQKIPVVSERSYEDAMDTYSVALECLARYVDEVRREVPLGRRTAAAPKPDDLGVDAGSVSSFWDAIQELGGAKTAVSTGVEGAETYLFAEWASHISAKDGYASLEAIYDDMGTWGSEWDGLWTNVTGSDGEPMVLRVGEDGTLANYDDLVSAARAANISEIVTAVPSDYTVRDRSTDSHGTPVPSLFAYMVSKRANGAEANNLKAKKAGLDLVSDSITKMQGLRRQVDDGHGGHRDADFLDIQAQLQKTARSKGIMAARAELANMLLEANNDLNYRDLTLSNYMCIADMMLIEGDDGVAHLRSLEMLFSAIKHRIGPMADELDDAEMRDIADSIVRDTGETAVGIAAMNPLDILDGIDPKRKAGPTSGIRPASSVFERNYNLLEAIEGEASAMGINPISPALAESLDRKNRGLEGIDDVMKRSSVARNYNVVGVAGLSDGKQDIRWTVGASNAVVIGDGEIGDADVVEICEMAYGLGMTVIVSGRHRDMIPSTMIRDAMPCSDRGDVIIPCFDMRLNGCESLPYNGGRFSIFQAPFSRYVVSVEDPINYYQLGDAQYKPTRNLTDRIKVIDNGTEQMMAEDLFPNVFRNPSFADCSFSVSLASGQEISRLIANGVRCTIDYGIVEGGNGFEQRKHDVEAAIERYRSRWAEADPDGIIRGGMAGCAPGDIVAWARIEIVDQYGSGRPQYAFAPIIPFPLHGATKNIPETFTVEQVDYVSGDRTLFTVNWTNTTEITDGYAKYFDSSGGANKGMIDFTDAIDEALVLKDGTPIDAFCAKASTDSRKIGTDRRIKTMISLMALARMHGYNFADSDGAFPEDPDLREMLLHERIPTSYWRNRMTPLGNTDDGSILFSYDPRINAFLNYECRKILANGGNPSDYLANVYTDENGVKRNTHVMWEFEAMFDRGSTYEDGLLRFLHSMDEGLCPDGIDDMGDGYLFRLYRDQSGQASGYDNGVLQMRAPFRLFDGSTSYIWCTVNIGMSFFGEDYSGFSRPNVSGASNFLDAMNTMSYHGVELDEQASRFKAMWASAGLGRIPHDGGALGKPARRMEE